MSQSITVVYEKGNLKPIKPLEGIAERSKLTITIEKSPHVPKKKKLARLLAGPINEELANTIEEGRKRPWPIEEF